MQLELDLDLLTYGRKPPVADALTLAQMQLAKLGIDRRHISDASFWTLVKAIEIGGAPTSRDARDEPEDHPAFHWLDEGNTTAPEDQEPEQQC